MDIPLPFRIILSSVWHIRDTWIVVSILLLLLFTLSRLVFPKVFLATYSLKKFFVFRQSEDFGTGLRLLSTENLHFTYLLSAASTFCILVIDSFPSTDTFFPSWLQSDSIIEGVLIWMGMSVVVVLLFLLRYLFISVYGKLFNLPNSMSRHFQEAQSLNQVFILFISGSLIVMLYSGFYFPNFVFQIIITSVGIYLIYRQFNLYFKFVSLGTYSKLYIFSYLCTTELIPVLIGINLLL